MPRADDPFSCFPEVDALGGRACFGHGRIYRPKGYYNPNTGKKYNAQVDQDTVGSSRRAKVEIVRLSRDEHQKGSKGALYLRGSQTCTSYNGRPTVPGKLVWFHISVGKQEAEEIRKSYPSSNNNFGTSRIFFDKPMPYHKADGMSRFKIGFNDLIESYKSQLGLSSVSFRIYGTTWYPQEIMHTILVCPPSLRINPRWMPWLNTRRPNGRSVQIKQDKNGEYRLFWKPWCTDGITYNLVWDHVTFAFWLPNSLDYWEVHHTNDSTKQTLIRGKGVFGPEKPW